MTVRRVMPIPRSDTAQENRDFYGLLGFEEVMDLGWILTLASPSTPAAQVSFMTSDRSAPITPDMSVEVDDVEATHADVRDSGAEIVHPLQDEEWSVRRFFVRDPDGRVINGLSHHWHRSRAAGEGLQPSERGAYPGGAVSSERNRSPCGGRRGPVRAERDRQADARSAGRWLDDGVLLVEDEPARAHHDRRRQRWARCDGTGQVGEVTAPHTP